MDRPKKSIRKTYLKKKLSKLLFMDFLHLLGFDHIKLKDYKKMFNEEQKIYPINYIKKLY